MMSEMEALVSGIGVECCPRQEAGGSGGSSPCCKQTAVFLSGGTTRGSGCRCSCRSRRSFLQSNRRLEVEPEKRARRGRSGGIAAIRRTREEEDVDDDDHTHDLNLRSTRVVVVLAPTAPLSVRPPASLRLPSLHIHITCALNHVLRRGDFSPGRTRLTARSWEEDRSA